MQEAHPRPIYSVDNEYTKIMNSVKTYLNGLSRGTRAFVLALAVVFVSAGIAQAATTISTNILTNGTLGVTGVSTFGGTASTTISVAGVLTTPASAVALFLGGASTTQFTLLSGDTIKNASASSTVISGALQTTGGFTGTTGTFSSTLGVTGLATLSGGATTTQMTLLSGDTIKNTTASTTVISGTLTPDLLNVTGATTLASTTATTFKVGNSGTQMSQIVSGYCVTTAAFSLASTTGVYADCTPYTSAGVAVSNLTAGTSRVFVQATSSLPAWIVIQAASTTAANRINVRMVNVSTTTTVGSDTYTFNFWAFQ